MAIPLAALMIAGGAAGALGGALTPKDKKTQSTSYLEPYGSSGEDLDRILSEAGRLYREGQGAYPTMDLSDLWRRLYGGGGGRGGSGGGGQTVEMQQVRGKKGGGGGGGYGAIKRFERIAQETPEQIGQGFEYAGNLLSGIDLTPYYQQYLDMKDLDLDSPIAQRIRESIGRATEEDMNRYLAAAGTEADAGGMYGSSLNALERSGTRGQFADALSDAILNAQLGLRGQQLGLMEGIQGAQLSGLGLIPELEGARLAGPGAAAELANARKIQAMANSAAIRQALINAQTQKSIAGSQLAQRSREFDLGYGLDLTQLGYQNELGAYNAPWALLNNYSSSVLPIASGFGTQHGETVQPGSRGANIIQGALGGALSLGGLAGG